MFRRFQERLRGSFGGRGSNKGGGPGPGRRVSWPAILGVVFLGWLSLGVYVVDEDQRGVITRFGAFQRVDDPGLHLHLPPPLEARQVIAFTAQRVLPVGYREIGSQNEDRPQESAMITGDRNIVEVDFRVTYRVTDAQRYLFQIRDQEDTVRGIAESTMRQEIGRRELDAILTTDRGSVEIAVTAAMQQVLDSYQAGIQILQVSLLPVSAPQEVIGAFNEVLVAGQEKEGAINRADQFRNERVPRASGEASQIIEQAEAYRDQVVREASGEAARFNLVYDAYRQNPRVTRDRMYLETMERIYRNADTVIIDQRSGAVPYLPLDSLRRRGAGTAGAPATPPTATPGTSPVQPGAR
jgi:membrane protease subunit HflK